MSLRSDGAVPKAWIYGGQRPPGLTVHWRESSLLRTDRDRRREHGRGADARVPVTARRSRPWRGRPRRHAGLRVPLPAGDGEDRQGPGGRPQALPGRPDEGQAAPGQGRGGAQGRRPPGLARHPGPGGEAAGHPVAPRLLSRPPRRGPGAGARRRGASLRSGSYFRFSTAGAAAFGLANALDTVPGGGAGFFLSVLGFVASRLVLFWPLAITVLPSGGCREPRVGPPSAGRQPEPRPPLA